MVYITKQVHFCAAHKLYNPEWDIDDTSKENRIDHENKNRSDNRIINLRNVTQQENCFNTNAKGYYWCKRDKKWRTRKRWVEV